MNVPAPAPEEPPAAGAGSLRRALLVLAAGVGLAAWALGWPWLWSKLIAPLSLVAWLLLRLFVLSVPEAAWWLVLTLAGAAVLGAFLLRSGGTAPAAAPAPSPARPDHPVESWRMAVQLAAAGLPAAPTYGWSGFLGLAVSLSALERRAAPDYRVLEALRDGQAPLPPEIRAFLFPPAPEASPWLARQVRRALGAPRRALRRLTGRDRAERLAAVDRFLSFLESSLEMTPHEPDADGSLRS